MSVATELLHDGDGNVHELPADFDVVGFVRDAVATNSGGERGVCTSISLTGTRRV
ncbi:hypothetical protein FHR84_003262 [Actinopolyspora biskrensis]|uniref:Uncharacterized protein n=1 Tax=Actinopolyspora biskrensis TaxID=1470178 RepID=A0A852ZD32_9ACTN|nr:hypothetical protein [Actinopolyspora biskrensis]NYH79913.1 hypothetical protein [Actinopolyspora biskrensis]